MTKENLEKGYDINKKISILKSHLLCFGSGDYKDNGSTICLHTEFVDLSAYQKLVQEKINNLRKEFESL